MQSYEDICNRFEIRTDFRPYCQLFDDTYIVFVIDDSGSMNTMEKGKTRYQELRDAVEKILQFYTIRHPEGASIYFLNQGVQHNVKNTSECPAFNRAGGFTPLAETLYRVYQDFMPYIQTERQLKIFIGTDGEPTSRDGCEDKNNFEQILRTITRFPNVFVSIVACTDNDDEIGYLDDYDKNIPRLDVTDDYNSEKKQILHVQGQDYKFSKGDWIIKLCFSPQCKELDELDEKRLAVLPPPKMPVGLPDFPPSNALPAYSGIHR